MTLSEPQMAAFDYRGARGEIFRSALPGGLKLLALALVEFMPHCRPSVATLAAHCGVERKTVLRALAKLEQLGVVAVERTSGLRSRYQLRDADGWRVPTRGRASTTDGPVPDRGTGDAAVPEPTEARTGTNETPAPVPAGDRTGTSGGPKADLIRSGKLNESGARARVAEPASPLKVLVADPTESYLAACMMAGVKPAQARDTWTYYATKGLPPGDYPNIEGWLVLMAKQRQNQLTSSPRTGAPARPGDDLDTTGAATVFRPNSEHTDFARAHLAKHDLAVLAQKCRQVPRFVKLSTAEQDREFMARLKHLRATGMFFADGPLPRPPARKEPTP